MTLETLMNPNKSMCIMHTQLVMKLPDTNMTKLELADSIVQACVEKVWFRVLAKYEAGVRFLYWLSHGEFQ